MAFRISLTRAYAGSCRLWEGHDQKEIARSCDYANHRFGQGGDLAEWSQRGDHKQGKLRDTKVGRRHLIGYASLCEPLLQPQPSESRRGRPRKAEVSS
jgi:hypothetical protein